MAKHFMSGIMLRGAIYSMTMIGIMITLGFVILLPFLVQRLDMNTVEATSYLLLSITTGWTVAWIRHLVSVNYIGWGRTLLLIPTLGVPCFLYTQVSLLWMDEPQWLLVVSLLLVFTVILLIRVRLKMQGTFMNDVQEDNKLRIRFTSLILTQAVDKPRATRIKTWVFRSSPYLYRSRSADRRLAGAAVKALFRNPQHRLLYLQFTGVCLLVMIGLPLPLIIKCLVLLAVYILLTYWHFRYWISFINDEWITLLPWSEEIISQAEVVAIRTMLLPFSVIMSIAFSLSWLDLGWGWVIIPLLVITLYGLTSYILVFLTLSNHK